MLFLFILSLSENIEQNPDPIVKVNKCIVIHHNIRTLYNNIKDLQIVCPKYDIILYSKILVSDRRQVNEIYLPGFKKPNLFLTDSMLHIWG